MDFYLIFNNLEIETSKNDSTKFSINDAIVTENKGKMDIIKDKCKKNLGNNNYDKIYDIIKNAKFKNNEDVI